MAKKPEKKPKAAEPATEAKPDAADTATDAKPASGLIGLLMLGAAALVSSFGLVYLLTPAPAVETTAESPACLPDGGGPPVVKAAAKPGNIYTALPEVLITVGSAPATRYLKMNISIISDASGAKAVKEAEPMLVDAFNTYLRSIEMADLEDPGFYPRMREQLTRRAELVLGSEATDGVLITQFLLR
jgi:flagellar FliL protein